MLRRLVENQRILILLALLESNSFYNFIRNRSSVNLFQRVSLSRRLSQSAVSRHFPKPYTPSLLFCFPLSRRKSTSSRNSSSSDVNNPQSARHYTTIPDSANSSSMTDPCILTSSVKDVDTGMPGFDSLQWDNASVKYLPVKDGLSGPRPVADAVYARVNPTPLVNPKLVATSSDALTLLGLEQHQTSEAGLAQVFSGNRLLPGSDPVAHCYCGHQFGVFAGQLGDGAAILLGEVKSVDDKSATGATALRWSVQLKGSGLTPFSRNADGRKVLRSSMREFLCSEHIDALQIPTTRAGCLVTSDSHVVRDIFYSGNPISERCSVVLRIAKTFIRFGSFEIFKFRDAESGRAGPSMGNNNLLIGLANFVIFTCYPHLITPEMSSEPYLWSPARSGHPTRLPVEVYRQWFDEVVERTARLVALWQCVGFCHGVLNTDNMSITGDTIDYGPFGFMEIYDPHYICNASDNTGRYTYGQQPKVCRWNCYKLYEMLNPLLDYDEEEIEKILVNRYDKVFESTYMGKMRAKLGLLNGRYENDEELIKNLFDTMRMTAADFTTTFKIIEKVTVQVDLVSQNLSPSCITDVVEEMVKTLGTKEDLEKTASAPTGVSGERLASLVESFSSDAVPSFLRQMLGVADHTLELWKDKVEFGRRVESSSKGSKCSTDRQLWESWLNQFANRLILDAKLDPDLSTFNTRRKELMTNSNPTVILRNSLAQKAIDAAEKDDYSEVRRLLSALRRPYDPSHRIEDTQRSTESLIVT